MFDFGILSINDRNLNYIKKLNPKISIHLADDKLETKSFLEKRGVGVPKTLAVISNKKQLSSFNIGNIKENSFVIKPVYGSKGRGILIVKKLGKGLYKISDSEVNGEYLIDHMNDILNGDFSLNYGNDKVLIEEKLIAGNGFENFCNFGLADIRMIVYNLVPVAAMIRMPTNISAGKANLAQGGVGLGVNVSTGVVNTIYINGKVYETNFPIEYKNLEGFKIPFWDEILIQSSKAQFFVNLGYLALDWVITETGPKLLEINARAGLEIQNVCLLPLKKRLDKVKDLKISDPEKGVELSKTLFSSNLSTNIEKSKIIYLSQNAKLILEDKEVEVLLKVDFSTNTSYISSNLKELIKKDVKIKFADNEIKNLKYNFLDNLEDNIVVFGLDIVKYYLVKPEHKQKELEYFMFKQINKNELGLLKELDIKVSILDKKVSLSSLKPINYLEELDNFIRYNGNYNPIFLYDFPSLEKVDNLLKEVKSISLEYFKEGFHLKSKFGNLFFDKLKEIEYKLYLLKAYINQDFENIEKYNNQLFGEFNKELLEISKQKTFLLSESSHLGNIISVEKVYEYIKKYICSKEVYKDIQINISNSSMSRVSVSKKYGNMIINISSTAIFREKELDGIIAHEIDTHLLRYIKGKNTLWNILSNGTANYLKTEEGLAVYNSLKFFPEAYEKNAMYQNYYLSNEAKKLDFKELAGIVFRIKGNDFTNVFRIVSRFKRGIIDTSEINSGAIYLKDKIYLDGYDLVSKYIENLGDIEKLMVGKIKIDDLEFIY